MRVKGAATLGKFSSPYNTTITHGGFGSYLDIALFHMTPKERFDVKLYLQRQKPLPPELAQAVLVHLGIAGHHDGKRSLSYRDAIHRRNQYINEAFNILPGKPWSRCADLVGRIVSEKLGDDQAGEQLKLAEQVGARMPTTIRQMARILGLSR